MLDNTKKRTLDIEEKSVGGVQTKMPKIGKGEVNEELREDKSTEETERKEETKEPIAKDTEDTESIASTSEPNKKPTTTKSFVFGSTTSFGNMGGFKMFGSNNSNNVFSMSNNKKDDEKTDNEKTCNEKTCNEKTCNEKTGNEKTGNEKTEDQKQDDEKCKPEESNKSVDKDKDTTTTKPISIFGSGSTFGNAFQAAINKKSIFDKNTEETKEDETDNEKEEENETDDGDSTSAKDVYKKVHLEKQDIKSGEEDEDTIFQIKAKLYHMELSKISNGWKEKGFGIIKVNKLNKCESLNYNSRLIMRQNGNLKLILNLPIIKDFKVLKGLPSSLNGNKFVRLQILENGELVQYAIKIGQVENAEKLFETITNQIPK